MYLLHQEISTAQHNATHRNTTHIPNAMTLRGGFEMLSATRDQHSTTEHTRWSAKCSQHVPGFFRKECHYYCSSTTANTATTAATTATATTTVTTAAAKILLRYLRNSPLVLDHVLRLCAQGIIALGRHVRHLGRARRKGQQETRNATEQKHTEKSSNTTKHHHRWYGCQPM